MYKISRKISNALHTIALITALFSLVSCAGNKHKNEQINETAKAETKVIPTVCLYSLGNVNKELVSSILDSLKERYPKCEYAGSQALPEDAITKKRHDHARYRTDVINEYLTRLKTDSTINLALTQSDVGRDNFRGQPHWGLFGEANGIGNGAAVVSSYRLHNHTALFRAILHELGHAEGLRHCKNKGCLMQNANGKNPFKTNKDFCRTCKAYMTSKHWKL